MSLLVAVYFDGIEDDVMKDVTGANSILLKIRCQIALMRLRCCNFFDF